MGYSRIIKKTVRFVMKQLAILLIWLSALCAFGQNQKEINKIDSVLSIYSSENKLNSEFDVFWKKNEEIYSESKKIGYQKGVARAASNLSMVYETQSDYKKSLEYALEAEKIGTKIKDTFSIANAKLQIGNIYYNTGDLKKSKEFYWQAYNIGKMKSDNIVMGDALNCIANYYQGVDSVDNALNYSKKALDKYVNSNEPEKISATYLKIGVIFFYLNNEPDSAKNYLKKAEKNCIKYNDKLNLAITQTVLSDIYKKEGNLKISETYLNSSLVSVREFGDKSNELKILSRLSKVKYLQNNYKEAYDCLSVAYLLKDTVLNSEKTKEITTAKLNSEFEKEKELIELKQKKEEEVLNAKIDKEQAIVRYLIITAVLLLSLAIVIFRIYRLKYKSEKIIEGKNKEIMDSIEYAKGIQQTILPKLPDNAKVLFKPKDIVSGDFYWYKKIGNVEYYAVADCTGHGVPGSLLSMLCTELLNSAVNNKENVFPSDILSEVHKELKRRMEILGRKDGMEISLISYDRNKKYLTYSGANRDLYIVHNNSLGVIRATKHGIGSEFNVDGEFGLYTTNVIAEGDMVYLTTDGYIDQFGISGKKFGSKQFKQFLEMKPDVDLLGKTMQNWQGNEEQTDDICVMTIKL